MAGLCRILIAATLVVHLTVGCCAHHAHACEGKDRPSTAHSDATPDGQRPGRSEDHSHHGTKDCKAETPDGQCPGQSADHSHHGAEDCQGEECSFVPPNRAVSDSFVLPLQALFVALLDDQIPLVGIGREQHTLSSGRLILPVRLHLANQVLLI